MNNNFIRLGALTFVVLVAGCASTSPVEQSGPTRQETLQSVKKDLTNLQAMLESWPETLEKRAQSEQGAIAAKGYFKGYKTFGNIGGAKALDKDAPLYAGAFKGAKIIAHMNKGTRFNVLDKQADWYGVTSGDQYGWVNARDVVLVGNSKTEISNVTGWIKDEIEKLVNSAMDWLEERRQKYESNPHIRIKGFKISLTAGVVPTVELEFEFK